MDTILKTFLKQNYSLQQARHRLQILKSYLDTKFFKSEANILTEEDSQWLKSLPPSFFKNFSKLNCQSVLEKLRQNLNKIEPTVLYLPIEIPESSINQIGTWFRKTNVYLFDVKLDPNLLGGCAISTKGVYKDYSLRLKIEAQKDKILFNLKGYLT